MMNRKLLNYFFRVQASLVMVLCIGSCSPAPERGTDMTVIICNESSYDMKGINVCTEGDRVTIPESHTMSLLKRGLSLKYKFDNLPDYSGVRLSFSFPNGKVKSESFSNTLSITRQERLYLHIADKGVNEIVVMSPNYLNIQSFRPYGASRSIHSKESYLRGWPNEDKYNIINEATEPKK